MTSKEVKKSSPSLPVIQETTSLPTIHGRRNSRLNDPIRQFRQRDVGGEGGGGPGAGARAGGGLGGGGKGKGTTSASQILPKQEERNEKLFHSKKGMSLTRKPSTDDIDLHLGRSGDATQAWEDNEFQTSSLSEELELKNEKKKIESQTGMTEKEKRKKIFRRLRSKSFDNLNFPIDHEPSPSPPPTPPTPANSIPTPEVKPRPSTAQKRRPSLSETSHSNSLGNISRPRSSSSQRNQKQLTPSRPTSSTSNSLKLKSEKLPPTTPSQTSAAVLEPNTFPRRPSKRTSRAFLRSGSKDDINVSYNSNTVTSKLDHLERSSLPSTLSISNPVISPPVLLRSTPQVFWRCRLNAMIHIYHHPSYHCFEIIALDLLTGEELPHVYIDLVRILEIMEEQVLKESYAERRSQRSQLLQTKSIPCAVNYILVLLDAHYVSLSSDEGDETRQHACEMNLQRYNGSSPFLDCR